MIQRHQVQANGLTYTISPDVTVPSADRYWGVVQVQLIDEITGAPVRTQTGIETDYGGLQPRVAGDGLVGLTGVPRTVFPDLLNQPYDVPLSVRATGYLPVTRTAQVPQDGGFPASFTPANLTIAMHAAAVTLRGRVVQRAGLGFAGVAGATVRITGVRRQPVAANVAPPPMEPPDLISLQPGVYANRPAVGSELRPRNVFGLGAVKTLTRVAPLGGSALYLNNRLGLGVGNLLMVEGAEPDRIEVHSIAAIDGASDPAQPAMVTPVFPLRVAHPVGTEVRQILIQPPGAAVAILDETVAGDLCLRLGGPVGVAVGALVMITGGVDPPEFQVAHPLSTLSDAQGYYRLPPLGRVAEVRIQAISGAQATERDISPAYGSGQQTVDLILP